MVFVACGLNHKTAPLHVREQLACTPAVQDMRLDRLLKYNAVNEATILSTCNRTEIYCDTEEPASLISWLAQEHQIAAATLLPHFYSHHGHEAVRHAFRVASGLDSMMLGEPQILGQMKQAYQRACRLGAVKQNLRALFEYAFSASKRIRSRSGIGNNPVSVAYAAVQLVNQYFDDIKALRVFLIGSGETANLVAKYLHKQGVSEFLVASRTRENAAQLAQTIAGKALTIGDIPQYLAAADVVVSATACPLPFINKSLVEHALNKRNNAPMFFLDLAVPRDIEAEVGDLPQVSLYNIDDLQYLITKGMDERKNAALQAEQLIDCEVDNYIRWHRSLRSKNVICDYRTQMQHLANKELQRTLEKLAAGGGQQEVMEEFCHRLVNKLTHYPSIGLRQAAWDGRDELIELAQYLFKAKTQQTYEEIS